MKFEEEREQQVMKSNQGISTNDALYQLASCCPLCRTLRAGSGEEMCYLVASKARDGDAVAQHAMAIHATNGIFAKKTTSGP